MNIHPIKGHKGEEMADMERRGSGVHADVYANALLREQPVKRLSSAGRCERWCLTVSGSKAMWLTLRRL